MGFQLLIIAHILLTTTGYVGLIAIDAAVLLLGTNAGADTLRATLAAWHNGSRIFGPFLGLGVLLGFALAATMHVPLSSPWLIATYALIALALAAQTGIVIPWERRAKRTLDDGGTPTLVPIRFVLVWLAATYTAIVALMVARPG